MNDSIIKNISTNSSSILNDIISNNTQNATTIISKIDPNWFYSASAQSAAVIVGLMGAFITTKILNQKFYIKQLFKEIDELDTKIEYIMAEITDNEYSLEKLGAHAGIERLKSIDKDFDPSDLPDFNLLKEIRATIGSEVTILKLKEYRKYKMEIDKKNGDLMLLENTLIYKTDQVESNKDFLDLRNHFKYLLIFSIFGVFLPLFMLLLDYNIMMRLRFIIYFLIVISWLIVLYSLYVEINNLKDQKPHDRYN